jgi:hypothetical protein
MAALKIVTESQGFPHLAGTTTLHFKYMGDAFDHASTTLGVSLNLQGIDSDYLPSKKGLLFNATYLTDRLLKQLNDPENESETFIYVSITVD